MQGLLALPLTAACPLIRLVLAYRSATVRDDAWHLPGICLTWAWRLGGGLLECGLEREAAGLPGLLATAGPSRDGSGLCPSSDPLPLGRRQRRSYAEQAAKSARVWEITR